MDLTILLLGITEFGLYVVFQMIFFRFIDERKVIEWVGKSYLFILVLAIVSYLLLSGILINISLLGFFISLAIYTMLVQIYILGVFGIAESSIRIRVLREIVDNNLHGLSYPEILQRYNKKTIIDKRLDRFVKSGELIYTQGKYKLTHKFSFSYIPVFIFSLYWKLYR